MTSKLIPVYSQTEIVVYFKKEMKYSGTRKLYFLTNGIRMT